MGKRTDTTAGTLAGTPVWPGIRHAFWNVRNPGRLTLAGSRWLIVERVLEHGGSDDKRWLREAYSDAELAEVVMGSRQISRRTALLWKNELGLSGSSRAEDMYNLLGRNYFGRV